MAHSNIKEKFLIEYDKANITSSYPSLTDYEIATILDKAYLAIIAQKLTGNNPRGVPFEGDNKAIEDVRPLIDSKDIYPQNRAVRCDNDVWYDIPDEMLYYIRSMITVGYNKNGNTTYSKVETKLVTHELAEKFMCTTHNKPWIEIPVCFLELNNIVALVDPVLHNPRQLTLIYIKKPNKFVDHGFDDTIFELSDGMAEELINLAIIMATETVENQLRLTSEISTRPLES